LFVKHIQRLIDLEYYWGEYIADGIIGDSELEVRIAVGRSRSMLSRPRQTTKQSPDIWQLMRSAIRSPSVCI
jgi:hypothetical protein